MIVLFFAIKTLAKNKAAFDIGLKNIMYIFAGGGAIIAIQHFAAASALAYVTQSIYTVIEFTHVFLLMILTSIIFKYKINAGKVISLVLAVIGLAFVLNGFSSVNQLLLWAFYGLVSTGFHNVLWLCF